MNRSVEVAIDWKLYNEEYGLTNSRERKNVIYKYAYINACKPFFGCSELGRITGYNHATILHAWRVHDTNLLFSPDSEFYSEVYEISKNRLDSAIGEKVDPLFFLSKRDLISIIRKIESTMSLIPINNLEPQITFSHAEEPCSTNEAVPGV
jgi:hypothetical protein